MQRKLVCLLAAVTVCAAAIPRHPHLRRVRQTLPAGHPSALNCTWKTYEQPLDHFNQGVTLGHNATFLQRVCVYAGFWDDGASPIFFYTGNESPVEEYVNNTGLMWQVGQSMGALLVFAEHRYEGGSFPTCVGVPNCASYGTSAQALADFARLVGIIKAELKAENSAVIAFGGSYGGMLSAWFRFKYPNVVDGAIAGSAPIWGFPYTMSESWLDAAARAISRGVSSAGGATDTCGTNLRSAWPLIKVIGRTDAGRRSLTEALRLCNPLRDEQDVDRLLAWAQAPWFDMAEGNYPFASTYITYAVGPGLYPLPPWPMREACRQGLNDEHGVKLTGDVAAVDYTLSVGNLTVHVNWTEATTPSNTEPDTSAALALIAAMGRGVGVWYNVTHEEKCFSIDGDETSMGGVQDVAPEPSGATCTGEAKALGVAACWYLVTCNEDLNLVSNDVMGVGRDIYWPPTVPRNFTVASVTSQHSTIGCNPWLASYGLVGAPQRADPWASWLTTYYGGLDVAAHSNVVFSNGAMDPWSGAGVWPTGGGPDGPLVQNLTDDGSVVALNIKLGGHHTDLFWDDPNDPAEVREARRVEEDRIREWTKAAREKRTRLVELHAR